MAGKAAMEVPEKALGIDLGTTYTCVGFWKSLEKRVEIITNEQGNRTTPSMVAFTSQETLVGQPAMNQYNSNPQNSVFDAKRLIGRRFSDSIVQSDKSLWPFQVVAGAQDNPLIEVNFQGSSRRFKPEEISSMILKKMKDTAQGFLQCEVNKAVITVPAYFSNSQRQATRDAGRLAGLQVMQLLNEPTAAAIAYSLDTVRGGRSAAEERVVVYDLGGGTFDVAVLKISSKNDIVVKAVKGDTHLGGQDFDNRLLDHFVQEFARKTGVDVSGNPKALRRLRNACERAKRELSSTVSTIVDVPCLHESQDFYCIISRAKFEQLNMDLFQRTTELVVECIHDALLSEADIDSVLLVGGSSRIPKLQQLLKDLFPKPVAIHRSINPDEAVAYGAAIKAAELTGARSGLSVVKDVTPLSLGILTRRKIMTVLIPRNTHIPVKKKGYFKTKDDNQKAIRIDVYEGERTNATDNLYLNGFSFTDLPPAPKGEEGIAISMEIDHDGILTVTAEHQSSNRREQLTVTPKSELLKQKEIENLVTKAGKFSLEDQEWKEIAKLKNKLDDDIYDAKKRLSNLRHVVDAREVAIHLDFLEQLRKSLDADSANLDMKQLQQKKSLLESKEEHLSQLVNNSRKPSSFSLIGRVFGN